MKKLKYILLMAGVLSLASCESLLDENPQYTINPNMQFSNEGNAQKALLGCYGYMTADNAYGQAWQEVTMGYSGLGWVQTASSPTDYLASLDGDPSEQINSMAWKGMYKVIGEVNTFIAYLTASPLEQNVKARMEAEARFLRALAYYNLAVTYGDLPLKTSISAHDGLAIPRSPKAQVFEQVRIDWEFAFNNLSEKNDDGYATKWAAQAYLGKLYHTLACQGDNTAWAKAKECFDLVYGKYGLESKFGNLFVDYVKGSKESIFQVNFVLAGASTRNRGSWLVAPSGACNGQAFDRIRSSKVLHDYSIATYPGDPRFESSFFSKWRAYGGVGTGVKPQVEPIPTPRDSGYAYPYFVYTKRGEAKPEGWKNVKQYVGRLPYEKFANPANPTMAELQAIIKDTLNAETTDYERALNAFIENCTKKSATNTKSWPYFKKPFDPNQSGNNSHKNLILYRYADMLLMMADVYNELDQKGKAIDLVDEVLLRARQSGMGMATQPAKWDANLTKEQVREKIYFERLFEGVGEPEMYQKMRLRGSEMLKKVLELNNNHGIIKESVTNNPGRNGNFGERIFNAGNLNDADFFKKNMLLPVPKDEIDTNSAINFTDNNFGYF